MILAEIRGKGPTVSGERYDDLWELFRSAQKRLVTQHVVSELSVSRLSAKLRAPLHDFWRIGAILFEQWALEERSCPFADLYGDLAYKSLVEALGPTDARLILVAKREQGLLLIDDEALRSHATSAGVRCWYFSDPPRLTT